MDYDKDIDKSPVTNIFLAWRNWSAFGLNMCRNDEPTLIRAYHIYGQPDLNEGTFASCWLSAIATPPFKPKES